MRLLSKTLFFLCFLGMIQAPKAQETIKLYPNIPVGSENWNWKEQQNFSKLFNTEVVFNVVWIG